jgi:hypothetical protein
LAARIRAARKIRCSVQAIPLATAGSFCCNRERYTKLVIKVGV